MTLEERVAKLEEALYSQQKIKKVPKGWDNNHPIKGHIIKNYPLVLHLSEPTPTQMDELLKTWKNVEIDEVLQAMENFKGLEKKYNSCYLTMKNWLKRRKEIGIETKHLVQQTVLKGSFLKDAKTFGA